jgi:hypothetical protein
MLRTTALMAALAQVAVAQNTGPVFAAQAYWMQSMELEESNCTPFCDPTGLVQMFDANATLVDATAGEINGQDDINNYLFAEFNFVLPQRGMRRGATVPSP